MHRLLFIALILFLSVPVSRAQQPTSAALPITEIKRDQTVDFQNEILPFLKDNCLACHNQTRSKAGLVLETPQTILKGGDSGAAAVPGKASESLVFKAAAHQLDDLVMPPKNNKVAANNLTPDQLGLLQLWINQGAKGEVRQSGPVHWQPLPASFQPIYAVAVTPDGRFVACSRGNHIQVYHLPSAQLIANLADPSLMSTAPYTQPTAHADVVQALAFNQDGTLLASGAFREIKLWRQPPPTQQFQFAANRPLHALAASPDGQWLALAGDPPGILLWNVARGSEVRLLGGLAEPVTALSFSPDSSRLLSVARDRTVRVWSLAQELASTNLPALPLSAAWVDAQRIAIGAEDHLIRLYSFSATNNPPLSLIRELSGHKGAVTSLAASQNQLLSGSADGTLRWWNPETGESTKTIEHGSPVLSVAARPDGKRFASVGDNRLVRLWDHADQKLVAEWKGDWRTRQAREKEERDVALAAADINYAQQVLKTANEELGKAEERRKKAVEGQEKAQQAFATKEKELAQARQKKTDREQALASLQQQVEAGTKQAEEAVTAATAARKEVEQTQSQTPANEAALRERQSAAESKGKAAEDAKQKAAQLAEELKTKEGPLKEEIKGAEKEIGKLEKELEKEKLSLDTTTTERELATKAFESDTSKVAQGKENVAKAEAAKKRAEDDLAAARQTESAAELPLRSLAFSPDNRWLAVAGDQASVHTCSAENGAPYDSLAPEKGAVIALAFVGADRVATARADGSAEVVTLRQPWTLEKKLGTGDASSPIVDRVNTLAFSPDQHWLASGGGEPSRSGEILLWSMPTGQLAHAWREIHSDSVLALEFSPDARALASSAADRFLRVTDLATGKILKAFEGHTHHVLGLSWKADGRTLASAGADNLIKIWNFETGERKKNVEGFGKEVTSVHYLGTTDQALATSGDNSVRLVNEDGKTVRQFKGPSDFVYASAVTADGSTVVAGGQDGILRVWNAADAKLLAELPAP